MNCKIVILLLSSFCLSTAPSIHAMKRLRPTTETNGPAENRPSKKQRTTQKQGFELDVHNYGRAAIPSEVVLRNIMPRMVIGLIAQYHHMHDIQIEEWISDKSVNPSADLKALLNSIIYEWNATFDVEQLTHLENTMLKFFSFCNAELPKENADFREEIELFVRNIQTHFEKVKQTLLSLDEDTKTRLSSILKKIQATLRTEYEENSDFWNKFIELIENRRTLHSDRQAAFKGLLLLGHPNNIDESRRKKKDSLSEESFYNMVEEHLDLMQKISVTTIPSLLSDVRQTFNTISPEGRKILFSLFGSDLNDFDQLKAKTLEILLRTQTLFSSADGKAFLARVRTHYNTFSDTPEFTQNASMQLCALAATDNIDLIEWITEYEGVDATNPEQLTGLTPLHCTRTVDTATYLISQHHVPVNAQDIDGNTPLLLACARENIELVQIFLKAGANPNMPNTQNITPLHQAIFVCAHSPDIATTLIKAGATIDSEDVDGVTPLTEACGELLIFACKKKNNTLQEEDYLCIRNNIVRTIATLLAMGANPSTLSNTSKSPLFYACVAEDKEVVSLLIKHGANPKPAQAQLANLFEGLELESAKPYFDMIEQAIAENNPQNEDSESEGCSCGCIVS